jgi:hypothetical protein
MTIDPKETHKLKIKSDTVIYQFSELGNLLRELNPIKAAVIENMAVNSIYRIVKQHTLSKNRYYYSTEKNFNKFKNIISLNYCNKFTDFIISNTTPVIFGSKNEPYFENQNDYYLTVNEWNERYKYSDVIKEIPKLKINLVV